ncbi:MAG: energy transducer TonB [Candidatus Latescibacterota bacterium]
MTASYVGFKTPSADLHRKSPRYFLISMAISIGLTVAMLQVPFREKADFEKKIKTPPVIIQLENIPETRQMASVPAPRISIPLEVSDDLMPDDVTIGGTGLDLQVETPAAPPPSTPVVVKKEETAKVEEEIFEFIAVEEKPAVSENAVPEYPESARRSAIEGTVFVMVVVDKEGKVASAEVLRGPAELHESALKAARATKFTPARQNDKPVSCKVVLPFRFVLEKK